MGKCPLLATPGIQSFYWETPPKQRRKKLIIIRCRRLQSLAGPNRFIPRIPISAKIITMWRSRIPVLRNVADDTSSEITFPPLRPTCSHLLLTCCMDNAYRPSLPAGKLPIASPRARKTVMKLNPDSYTHVEWLDSHIVRRSTSLSPHNRKSRLITSAKEVMFLPVFVCLFVCLFVCVSRR